LNRPNEPTNAYTVLAMTSYDTTMQETLSLPMRSNSAPSSDTRQRILPVVRTSVGGLAVVFVLAGVFLVTGFNRLNHTDLWGHLALGRWMVNNHAFVDGNALREISVGAAHMTGATTVVNVPWLAQVLGYVTYMRVGADGLILGHALLATLACGVCLAAVRRQGVALGWAVAAAVVVYVISLPVMGTIRPQLFGALLFPCVLYAVADLAYRARALFWLPIVFALWANLHGSFAIGLILLGCWMGGVLLETRRELRSWRLAIQDEYVRRLAVAMLLSAMACSLNPAGPALLWSVARFSGGSNLGEISEWRPLVLESLGGTLFFLSVLATFVVVRYSPRRLRAEEIVTLVVFAALTLSAMRMLAWWSFVWPFVIAPHAAACWKGRRHGDVERPAPSARRTWLAVAVVFVAIVWSPPAHSLLTVHPRGLGVAASPDTPLHVAEALEEHIVTGPIFAPMDWADYLLWRNGGHVRPLVFTHVHLFPQAIWSDFLELSRGGAAWLDVIDYYGLEYLVLDRERNRNLHMLAILNPRCRVLYQDQQAVLVEILPAADAEPAGQGGVAEAAGDNADVAGNHRTAEQAHARVDERPHAAPRVDYGATRAVATELEL